VNRLFLVLLVFVAHPLFAACTGLSILSVTPARPTVTDEIEVVMAGGCTDGCIPHSPRVKVAAGVVTVELQSTGGCVLVPTPWGERVNVGRIPAGTYTLVVRHNATELGRTQLVVRDHPFAIKPSFGNAGTIVLIDQRDHGSCAIAPCPPPEVTFGGTKSASVTITPDGDIAAVAPEHAPGLVDVVVVDRDNRSTTASQAFLYPNPQADLTGEHERVLYPIAFEGPGARGSDWRTENLIANRGPIEVNTIPLFIGTTLEGIEPGERRRLPAVTRDGGLLFFIPRGMESWLAYGSHIADRSRRATDAGTELRVVHEKQAGSDLTILDVPLTAESRQTLRIYDLDAFDGREVNVEARIEGRPDAVIVTAVLTHRIVCVTSPCYPEHPTYAVLNLDSIPQLRNAGTADLTIRSRTNDALLWAFVSVTNNDTQHVTTYSPQHRRMSVP
jgi:hypothetical protein